LVDNGCNIWNGDAYKNYCKIAGAYEEPDYDVHIDNPNEHSIRLMTQEEFINRIKKDSKFAQKWGELGQIYGRQWRNWDAIFDGGVDQIQKLIDDLKTNPDSRRLMVNAWNVGELGQMVLPPCHYGFQVYTRELSAGERWDLLKFAAGEEWYNSYVEDLVTFGGGLSEEMELFQIPERAISLMWNQRSVDTFLGLPFNIASYGLLLEIIAQEVNMIPEELIGNLGDVHLYSNHIDQAKEQISRESYELPSISYLDEYHYLTDPELVGDISFSEKIYKFRPDFFKIEDYQSHETIKAPLSN
jgi:thymidylate synthase